MCNEIKQSADLLDKWKQYVAKKVITARNRFGWSQEELAERSELPVDYISRLEAGNVSPSNLAVGKLSTAFGVTLNYFYDYFI